MARAKLTWGTCPACSGAGMVVVNTRTQTVASCKKCNGAGRTTLKAKPKKKVKPLPPPVIDLQEEQDLKDHLEGLS